MDNPKTEETTHSDTTEPIVSWSGVQGETQGENVEVPNADELHITKPEDKDSDADQQMKEKDRTYARGVDLDLTR